MALTLFRILQDRVRTGDYEVTAHAFDEAEEDELHVVDIESAILTGVLARVERGDPRGAKCIISGLGADLRRRVGVVARLARRAGCVIITVYEIRDE